MGGLALKLRATKLLLMVVSGYKKITATFSNCGKLLRYSSSSQMLKCTNLDNPQPMVRKTKVQRLNGNGYRERRCLRYSPSLREHSKVQRQQLDRSGLCCYVLLKASTCFQNCFCRETSYSIMFFTVPESFQSFSHVFVPEVHVFFNGNVSPMKSLFIN